jgi:hypothetical protein
LPHCVDELDDVHLFGEVAVEAADQPRMNRTSRQNDGAVGSFLMWWAAPPGLATSLPRAQLDIQMVPSQVGDSRQVQQVIGQRPGSPDQLDACLDRSGCLNRRPDASPFTIARA